MPETTWISRENAQKTQKGRDHCFTLKQLNRSARDWETSAAQTGREKTMQKGLASPG